MDNNRDKQIKESHITQTTDKQLGTGPFHVVITPTSLTVGQQQKCLQDNKINGPIMTYSTHSSASQTRPKPVRVVMMPTPSTADQQISCTSTVKQSERTVLLLPHTVLKQSEKTSSQSHLTNEPPNRVLTPVKACRLTCCNTTPAEHYIGIQDDNNDSPSVLQATCSKDVQQFENMNTSKDSKLKEKHLYELRPDSRPGMVPPHLIVMTASPKEIDYRIKAFLARKQAELDVQNVEEYCLHLGMNPNVCARVDATVHQHRKRKKRKFEFAPQPEEKAEATQFLSKDASQEQLPLSVAHPILEERVANIEEHVRLGKPVPKDIYSRLKRIEDRILKLEGISTEYIYDAAVNLHPPRTLPKVKRVCTVDELDAKIAELQKKFEKKPNSSSQKDIIK